MFYAADRLAQLAGEWGPARLTAQGIALHWIYCFLTRKSTLRKCPFLCT